jgi:hypothetical protein
MKIFTNNRSLLLIFTAGIIAVTAFNILLNIHPVLEIIKYLEKNDLFWILPTICIIIAFVWLYHRDTQKKIIKERIEIYNATIHTIQDILHKSSSSMQLLILDMKDEEIRDDLVVRAEENLDELNQVTRALSDIDPEKLQFMELKKNLSIINMHKEQRLT